MARMPMVIVLSDGEKLSLKEMTKPTSQHRYVQRAKAVLMAADGKSNSEITKECRLSKVSVCRWKKSFTEKRLEGLKDIPRSGRPRIYMHDDVLKVINTACSKPPEPETHWTIERITQASGTGMKKSRVHKILSGLDLKPHHYRMWLFSNDPEFEKKELEVCGLYINPPENSLVICVDEKPAIQALERLHPPQAVKLGTPERTDFNYRRHGIINLFAALRVHDGKIYGKTTERKKAPDFLAFLNEVYVRWASPGRQLHLIMDNYGTHTAIIVKEWLSSLQDVQVHFTPTHASWLNQIELWFSIIHRRTIQRGDFKSQDDLARKLILFIEQYNKDAKPFAWTYKGKPLKVS